MKNNRWSEFTDRELQSMTSSLRLQTTTDYRSPLIPEIDEELKFRREAREAELKSREIHCTKCNSLLGHREREE